MTGALDVADACARLARIVVPALADLCAVDLAEQPGPSRRVAVAAGDAADEALLRELGALRGYAPGAVSDTGGVLDGGGRRPCRRGRTPVRSSRTSSRRAFPNRCGTMSRCSP